MFLKQLDIIGFKSFADKITIEFVPGVTAVVGPNGSGKSNITDAIRWVLGEQSAKSLRGGKMEDIIFSGSDTRKPLNYAEVSLTLNNEDHTLPIEFNEVCVARRVFRSGESEYFLNGRSTRLKDIVDLFMDSGLGKEAFSIISQGKVEEILNSKPEERRAIFEEAAGVLKYKTRKKQAEAKLQETSENLNRVNDIIHELEGQIEPLKIQASIAKDYLEKKKELMNHEVALTVYEIGSLHEKWEKSNRQLEKLQDKEINLSNEMLQIETLIETERIEAAKNDERITELQSKLLTLSKQLENLEGKRELLKERKNNATQNTRALQENLSEIEAKLAVLQNRQGEIEGLIKEKENEVTTLQQLLSEKRKKAKSLNGSIEETIETLKADYIDILNQQATAKNEIKYLEEQLQQQVIKSNRLDAENKKYIEQRTEINCNLTDHLAVAKNVEAEIENQKLQYKEVQERIQILKLKFEEKTEVLNKANQFLQKAKSRKETLEEMEEDYSGFYQGVREILKARNQVLEGIEGAVAELIQVPKEYAAAIETALGASMQNIVVTTDNDGRRAIQFLKQKRLGRATFLPLNIMKEKYFQPQPALTAHPSFVGIAADLVDYQEKYRSVIRNLLGHIIIARDINGASAIAKMFQHRYRIVTLDGDVINPGGSMTGGTSIQRTNSLLSRKTELDELNHKLSSMITKTNQLENEWKELKKQLEIEEQELEEIRIKGENLRIAYNEVETTISHIKIRKNTIDERLALYDLEMNELKTEKNRINKRLKLLTSDSIECEKKIQSLNLRIEQLTEQKHNERQSKESLTNEITELSSNLAVAKEQFSTYLEQLKILEKEMNESQLRRDSIAAELQLLTDQMSGHHVNQEELALEIDDKKQEKQEIEDLLAKQREERLQLQISIEQKDANLKEQKREYKGITTILKDEEVKNNRLDVELDNLLNKLRDEYGLSYEGAKNQYPLLLPLEETEKKVKLIKMEIDELGTVNLGAIDEYDRVNERYKFLLEQQMDLSTAKDQLFEVMNEMDEEMKHRFSKTFQDIQAQFKDVFVALFGGGRAELKLTNPEDMLHTGVDIVAQPPGKNLQNLSLLSGGERSLTAIALLFSILKIRPVPFCVLDEVEAALDEANVHRFSHYLREFSKETQFIVITHRQGTMQGADVLYGVTMQESGVSKIVSVKLVNNEEIVQIS